MQSGQNPTRRNRNIGTAKQGHGQNNRQGIPKSWPDDRIFWEVLNNPIAINRTIGEDIDLTFLVEPPRPDCFYPCTVEDICILLELVPEEDLQGIELIIFRQPTRKQMLISSVWGRFIYYATPGGAYSGTAICIEAHNLAERFRWPTKLALEDQQELERLANDGHQIEQDRRHYTIKRTPESVRNTVLFRTVLHELGHYVDWQQSVLLPSLETSDDAEDARISQAFDGKTSQEKEAFAHRYAQEQSDRLRALGHIPFPLNVDASQLKQQGLEPDWFITESGI